MSMVRFVWNVGSTGMLLFSILPILVVLGALFGWSDVPECPKDSDIIDDDVCLHLDGTISEAVVDESSRIKKALWGMIPVGMCFLGVVFISLDWDDEEDMEGKY